jgi:hypothetical protein
MKLPRNLWVAVLFIGVLILIGGGVWAYDYFLVPLTSTGNPSASGTNIFGSLFPFGNGSVKTPTGGIATDNGSQSPVPELRRVTDQQVAGATFATGQDGTEVIRYVERQTGHIFETPVNSFTTTRLTNTTIPAVHDALWISASSTIMRFTDTDGVISNFVGSFDAYTADQSLQGTFLKKYSRIGVIAGGAALVGVLESVGGSTIETVQPDGLNPKTILTSSIRSWIPLGAGNSVLVATAPASGVSGSLFDTAGGTLTKLISDISGLEALPSPSGSKVLISSGAATTVVLSIYDRSTGDIQVLPRGTLVDKCAWTRSPERILCAFPKDSLQQNYPDDWLLGRAHTNDDLWFINPITGSMTEAANLTNTNSIDVSRIVVDPTGDYAVFIDRSDASLWSAQLTLPQ